jgi:hypothetical protein
LILLLDQNLLPQKLPDVLRWPWTGVHAVLVVFSVRNRFSEEEVAAVRSLQTIFGSRILDYIIVVFTGGDEFEDNDETFEDYLGSGGPADPLKVSHKAAYNFALLVKLF